MQKNRSHGEGLPLIDMVQHVQANTAAVRSAVVRPVYGALLVQPQLPPPEAAKATPLIFGTPGRCTRSPSCAKPSGHPGFCSGPKPADAVPGSGQGTPEQRAAYSGSPLVSEGSSGGTPTWRPGRSSSRARAGSVGRLISAVPMT